MIQQSPDLIVFGGDAIHTGTLKEFRQFIQVISQARKADIPVVMTFGNHDHWKSKTATMRRLISDANITLLDGQAVHFPKNGKEVGVTGVEGYCEVPDIAIEETRYHDMRARRGSTILKDEVGKLERGLSQLHGDANVVVLHYPPANAEEELATAVGEPDHLQTNHMLGASELGFAIAHHNRHSQYKVEVLFHGHLDFGSPNGQTDEGLPVINTSAKARQRREIQPYEVVDLIIPQSSDM